MVTKMKHDPTVFVVDDDDAVRSFLSELIASVGLNVETYASAQKFLDTCERGRAGCLVLDIRMPGMSGLELQKELVTRDIRIPVIILTGHGDVQTAVETMKAGAFDFIEKPFNNELLLDRVQRAVAQQVDVTADSVKRDEIADRRALLTPRERQVMDMVANGEMNKLIAHRLGISEKTVEIHRSKVMEKMQARSLAELVRMVVLTELR
jgi:FixJ family two-component response regulator